MLYFFSPLCTPSLLFNHCELLYFFPHCALLLFPIDNSILLYFPPPAFLSGPSCPIQLKGNKWKERAKEDRRPPEHNDGEEYGDAGGGGAGGAGGDAGGDAHGGDLGGHGDSVCGASKRGW